MGKKKAEEMAKQREVFVKGCAKVNSIPAGKANQIFDLLEKVCGLWIQQITRCCVRHRRLSKRAY